MRAHLAFAMALGLVSPTWVWPAPQLVIVNARVFTAEPARPWAEAVAIEAGRFSAVGSDADIRALADGTTRVIDAGGRLVTPGLVEAHVHLGSTLPSPPIAMPGLPFPGPSAGEVLAAVGAASKEAGDWISGIVGPLTARDARNWRVALDDAAPDRPVVLVGFWGHTTLLNSAALKRLGVAENVRDPLGGWWGRDAAGRLDGRAFEAAEDIGWHRLSPPDPARTAAEFQEAGQRYARWGVTSIHLMNSSRTLAETVEALARGGTQQKWTVYSWARGEDRIADAWRALDAAPRPLPRHVRIDGPKWLLDGTGIEQNAKQRAPYVGRAEWRGRSNYTGTQLREILQTALRRPEQLALHVVGDAETDRLFKTMEALAPAARWAARRVRVEHGDGIRADTLAQAARLGVVVTQNPTHLPPPLPEGAPRLFDRLSILRSLVEAGVPLALGSDGGPDEANPFLNIMLASTYAAAPGEALTREQALLAYTSGGAFAERLERAKGRIAPGMAADLAVLSQDILTVPWQALPATTSVLTILDGEVVHEDPVIPR